MELLLFDHADDGTFVGDSWSEWNGRFRHDARRFFRGDDGALRGFADRLVGSPEVYGHKEREPEQSINFITCHDGFTLNDLVSYDCKHNEVNNDENRDGCNDNFAGTAAWRVRPTIRTSNGCATGR